MKKITNKSLQTALLRGAVLVSGGLTTTCAMLFCNSIYSLIFTAFIGSGLIVLIDNCITDNLEQK